jgi:hypothetical protein
MKDKQFCVAILLSFEPNRHIRPGRPFSELYAALSERCATGLVADAIPDLTRRGDLVLDLFLGSRTTLITFRLGRN